MSTQRQKADHFRALHARDEAFIIPNPWDRGSARLLEQAGFEGGCDRRSRASAL